MFRFGVCPIIAVAAVAVVTIRPALAEASSANILRNPSFEIGVAEPVGWRGFGFGERIWGSEAHQGKRSVSVFGDGNSAGWWYSSIDEKVEHNELYRVSGWARSTPCVSNRTVVFGLNHATCRPKLTSEWTRFEFFTRAPDFLPDPMFRLGQIGLKGSVLFDDVSMVPAVAVHQSVGTGARLSLGKGESVDGRSYTASHDLSDLHTMERRFLRSYTAEFDGDRWVLDGLDEVVYRHGVERIGADLLPADTPAQTGCAQPVQVDISFEIHIERCLGGALDVHMSHDGKSWNYLQTIKAPGDHRIEVPSEMTPSACPYIRIKSSGAGRVEVSRYQFRSRLGGGPEVNGEGGSRYLAVLYASPHVDVEILDVGDMRPDGRSEVKLHLINRGTRMTLDADVWIERDGQTESHGQKTVAMAPGRSAGVCLPYTVESAGEVKLTVRGRDAKTGKLLFLFEGDDKGLNGSSR